MSSLNNIRSRNYILEKIKSAQEKGIKFPIPEHDNNSSVFPQPHNLLETFAQEFEKIGGKIIVGDSKALLIKKLELVCRRNNISSVFCLDSELKNILKETSIKVCDKANDFERMKLAVTQCEFLVARTGSIVVSSNNQSGRRLNVFPPIHVVFAKASTLVSFPDEALEQIKNQFITLPSFISFITGASRTADIEKTLVMGAHGPKELFVFIDKNA